LVLRQPDSVGGPFDGEGELSRWRDRPEPEIELPAGGASTAAALHQDRAGGRLLGVLGIDPREPTDCRRLPPIRKLDTEAQEFVGELSAASHPLMEAAKGVSLEGVVVEEVEAVVVAGPQLRATARREP
jgi:hypothetical protein